MDLHPIAVGRPFFDVELKIARARLHAQQLGDSARQWIEKNPPALRAEFADERATFRLMLEPHQERPALEHWGLLIGDCVHNLRSALDNLVYALALTKRDPPENPKDLFFPVCATQDAFAARNVQNSLKQLPDEAAAAIELWQPFHRGENLVERDALRLLHHLSNQDKHRIPQVVIVALGMGDHTSNLEFFSDSDATAFTEGPPAITIHAGPVEAGTVVYEVRGNRPLKKVSGGATAELVPAIRTLVGLEGVLPTIDALGQHTEQIFAHLRMFAPGAVEYAKRMAAAQASGQPAPPRQSSGSGQDEEIGVSSDSNSS